MPASVAGVTGAAVTPVAAIAAQTAQATAAPPESAPWAPPPARPMTYHAVAPRCGPAPHALERLCHWLGACRWAIGPAAQSPVPPPHVPTMCQRVRERPAGRADDAGWSFQRRSGHRQESRVTACRWKKRPGLAGVAVTPPNDIGNFDHRPPKVTISFTSSSLYTSIYYIIYNILPQLPLIECILYATQGDTLLTCTVSFNTLKSALFFP